MAEQLDRDADIGELNLAYLNAVASRLAWEIRHFAADEVSVGWRASVIMMRILLLLLVTLIALTSLVVFSLSDGTLSSLPAGVDGALRAFAVILVVLAVAGIATVFALRGAVRPRQSNNDARREVFAQRLENAIAEAMEHGRRSRA